MFFVPFNYHFISFNFFQFSFLGSYPLQEYVVPESTSCLFQIVTVLGGSQQLWEAKLSKQARLDPGPGVKTLGFR